MIDAGVWSGKCRRWTELEDEVRETAATGKGEHVLGSQVHNGAWLHLFWHFKGS